MRAAGHVERQRGAASGALLALAALLASALIASSFVPTPSLAPGRGGDPAAGAARPLSRAFELDGLSNAVCVATIRAGLEKLPGIAAVRVDMSRAVVSWRKDAPGPSVEEVVAAIRATGHDAWLEGSEDARRPVVSPGEAASLAAIHSEWLLVSDPAPSCRGCDELLPQRLLRCSGVREVDRIPRSSAFVVQGDSSAFSALLLASAARTSAASRLSVTRARPYLVKIDGMRCHKCVAAIEAKLGRTPGILHAFVGVGEARVVTADGVPGKQVAESIDATPAPSCHVASTPVRYGSRPDHVFKATILPVPGQPGE